MACPYCETPYTAREEKINWLALNLEVECDHCNAPLQMGARFCFNCGIIYDDDHWVETANDLGIDLDWALRVTNGILDDDIVEFLEDQDDDQEEINLCCNQSWNDCSCEEVVTPEEFYHADYLLINKFYSPEGGCEKCSYYGLIECPVMVAKFVEYIQENKMPAEDITPCELYNSPYLNNTATQPGEIQYY